MDRRFVLAIVLMMVVLIVPPLFFKQAPRRIVPPSASVDTLVAPRAAVVAAPRDSAGPVATDVRDDTVRVTSPLYTYGFTTRGGKLVEATLHKYRSMRKDEAGRPVQIMPSESDFLSLALLVGRDTIAFDNVMFTPSAPSLTVSGPTELSLTGVRDSVEVALRYRFRPDDYRIDVAGTVRGLGPNGGMLLIGMGPALRNTESDSTDHFRQLAIVTKDTKSTSKEFFRLKVGEPAVLNGPYEWVAVKSKYFVTALLALDSTATGARGGIGGARMVTTDAFHKSPTTADILTSIAVPASGGFSLGLYAGPMEHPRLRQIGHDFDDVNPYGWPGFRTIIRPVAVGARWLLVWMHDQIGIAYGLGLVIFGVLVRILLWPLNQKAMRSSMRMQALQPVMKELQDKYQKTDPQRYQQEMMRVYKEHNVNPFGGCLPMLLPWPAMIALFFTFGNTIELRGASFLWLPDLARPDPLYIIPILMGLSMFVVSRISQTGLPPNPQTKMMLYVMPVFMTVFFAPLASGLNLYYTVQNLASIPQQWLIVKERLRNQAPAAPKVEVKRKK